MQADEFRRVLGLESQSMLGQALPGVNQIRGLQTNNVTNLSRAARNQLADLDNLLDEIEQYQNETDQMAGDMAEINNLL